MKAPERPSSLKAPPRPAPPAPAPAVKCQYLRVKVVGRMENGDLLVEALNASGASCDWRTYYVPAAALEGGR